MTIHVALNHLTSYKYDRPINVGPQVVRLRPAPHSRTRILSYSLRVLPKPHFINWQQDPQSNYLARLVFPEKVTEFSVEVDLVAEMSVINPFDFFLEPEAEHIPFKYSSDVQQELAPYLATEPMTPLVQAYLDKIDRSKQRTIDFLVKLNQQVSQDIRYLIRLEPGVQTPEETLQKASGGPFKCRLARTCRPQDHCVTGDFLAANITARLGIVRIEPVEAISNGFKRHYGRTITNRIPSFFAVAVIMEAERTGEISDGAPGRQWPDLVHRHMAEIAVSPCTVGTDKAEPFTGTHKLAGYLDPVLPGLVSSATKDGQNAVIRPEEGDPTRYNLFP